MKSEHMVKAYELFGEFEKTLRMAHTDAVEADDQFAEILIYSMLEKTSEQHLRLRRMSEAAK